MGLDFVLLLTLLQFFFYMGNTFIKFFWFFRVYWYIEFWWLDEMLQLLFFSLIFSLQGMVNIHKFIHFDVEHIVLVIFGIDKLIWLCWSVFWLGFSLHLEVS